MSHLVALTECSMMCVGISVNVRSYSAKNQCVTAGPKVRITVSKYERRGIYLSQRIGLPTPLISRRWGESFINGFKERKITEFLKHFILEK